MCHSAAAHYTMGSELETLLSTFLPIETSFQFAFVLFFKIIEREKINKIKKRQIGKRFIEHFLVQKNSVTEICNAPLKSQDIGLLGVDKENLCNLKLL